MARPADGDPITFMYAGYPVQGMCRWRFHAGEMDRRFFMAESPNTTAKSVFVDYEGIQWERGWTDGKALLAAYALLASA